MVKALSKWNGELIVSCQALDHEPLHSPFIMGRMALAAFQGGAKGIRANGKDDILEMKKQVSLPIIALKKQDYLDSEVFITPTLTEVKELLSVQPEMIALDATNRKRPNNENIEDLIAYIRNQAPNCLLMADISNEEEAIKAADLGFDCVSTTLIGYTKETVGISLFDDDFSLLKSLVNNVNVPIIAEGKISTPTLAKNALANGAHAVVVGSAITRPQEITKAFNQELHQIFL